VGVHLQRFLPFLDRAGIDYLVYNTAGPTEIPGRAVSVSNHKRWWFLKYLLTGEEPVIYIMNEQWEVWAASWFLSLVRGKKVIISLRSEHLRMAWTSRGPLARRWIARGMESATRIVAVNQHICDFVMQLGNFADKMIVVPGFIPPADRPEDEASVPTAVREFCADHDPVLLAMGAPVIYQDTTDLYGIDMGINLVDRLRRRYPKVGLLWLLLDFIGSIPEYAERMRQEVARRGLENHWRFQPPQKVLCPIYKLADLFVRPTCTDGDANSIREAMHFGVPVVASDAAPRPDAAILFRTRDQEDFERTVCRTLDHLETERDRLKDCSSTTAVNRIVSLLQEVIAEAHGQGA
jgi:glycosyltransferase involved in cell wall biosynthesis